jgi:8-oxo-dGTP pyrophosphatase MutT (NUDIX family)
MHFTTFTTAKWKEVGDMTNWKESVKKALEPPLPGLPAQELMEPTVRFTGTHYPDPSLARQSSVLILIYPSPKGFCIPFIQRPDYAGAHGGQISLPGGKRELSDTSNWGTALRETNEELGIPIENIEFLGELSPLFIPNSNYIVYPEVGCLGETPEFYPSQFEVSEVIEVPVKTFCSASNIKRFSRTINGRTIEAPYFDVEGRIIWGATAMIMSELIVAFRERAPRWANALHFCSAHTFQESPAHNEMAPPHDNNQI